MPFLAFLVANPLARLAAAVAITGLVAFSAGFLRGHESANAAQWHKIAIAAKAAAEAKERLSEEDRSRAEAAELELSKSTAQLEIILHDANSKPGSCKLSAAELDGLQRLSAGTRRVSGNALPAISR